MPSILSIQVDSGNLLSQTQTSFSLSGGEYSFEYSQRIIYRSYKSIPSIPCKAWSEHFRNSGDLPASLSAYSFTQTILVFSIKLKSVEITQSWHSPCLTRVLVVTFTAFMGIYWFQLVTAKISPTLFRKFLCFSHSSRKHVIHIVFMALHPFTQISVVGKEFS